jgi:cysteine desulfurase
VFTSGGTESDNAAIKGVFFALREKGRHIVTTAVEHHAVLHSCRYLEERFGCRVSWLPVDGSGLVDPEAVGSAITPETVLVTVMMANNETGSVNAIADIGKVTRAKGVLFHTDAVQAVGKIPIDVNDLGVDLLSLSGHKFYGPKGKGDLYVRPGTSLDPFVHGGGHEGGRRAGTENIPGIAGLGQAAESARVELEEERKRQEDLRDYFWQRIDESIPDVRLNGHPTMRLPNTLNVSFPRLEGESALLMLDNSGVAISTGSACSSEELEPSHVLTAMGVDNLSARGALRFSLGRENTRAEIDARHTSGPDPGVFRKPLTFDRRHFVSSRERTAAFDGLVARRRFFFSAAFLISDTRRSRASRRFLSLVRSRRASMTRTPSTVSRLPARCRSRVRTFSGREGEFLTSKRSWTAVETLLTFWPPGPEARTNRMVISRSGIRMSLVTAIMEPAYHSQAIGVVFL